MAARRIAEILKTKGLRPKSFSSKRFSGTHQQMFDNWSKTESRKES